MNVRFNHPIWLDVYFWPRPNCQVFFRYPVMLSWMNISIALAVLFVSCWILIGAHLVRAQLPTLRHKRVCLLIAHPDDEAMFFAPTLLALTQPELKNHVKILCLSNGNNEGLGEIRRKELLKSGMRLGLRKEEDVLVVESQDFPDSMETYWDKSKVASLLLTAFAPSIKLTSTKESKEIYRPTIDILITFDSKGVSNHPNHISLFHGARCFISSLAVPGVDWASPVSLYTLTSISILRKYTFFLDILASGIGILFAKNRKNKKVKGSPQNLLFLSGLEQMLCAQDAMISCHQSQMKWFRWGWILLSRYMTINDLRLEKSVGSRKV
ncbi:hypothetical protein Golomagni_03924 [Golovinomyces magnicellulatus]|nr:hypothetical protein Golomagni_03924 [Golovinomyces magnicellulatus]